jgi:hypothetical protein
MEKNAFTFEKVILDNKEELLPTKSGEYVVFLKAGGLNAVYFDPNKNLSKKNWLESVFCYYSPVDYEDVEYLTVALDNTRQSLSELIRSLSKAINKHPNFFMDHDAYRLQRAQQVLAAYSNEDGKCTLVQSKFTEFEEPDCYHPYNECVMSDKVGDNGLILLECKVCGKLL